MKILLMHSSHAKAEELVGRVATQTPAAVWSDVVSVD